VRCATRVLVLSAIASLTASCLARAETRQLPAEVANTLEQGMECLSKGDLDRAIATFNKAIRLEPDCAEGKYRRE